MPSSIMSAFSSQKSTASSTKDGDVTRSPLIPTENFESTFPDGVMTVNAFEFSSSDEYKRFVSTLQSRLVETCKLNPWLMGRLEQTKQFTLASPLNGEFCIVHPKDLDEAEIDARVQEDIFAEAPADLMLSPFSIKDSPFEDLARFLSKSTENLIGMVNQLHTRSYNGLSAVLKAADSTKVEAAAKSAKTGDPFFRVVVVPVPSFTHAFVVVTLSHAVGDGNTYHNILHMLLASTDRKTGETSPIKKLVFDSEDAPKSDITMEEIVKNYQRERDYVVPPAKIDDQLKLATSMGITSVKSKVQPERLLRNFVALVNLDELNRIKAKYNTKEEQEAVMGKDTTAPLRLSANDVLVCELAKIMKVNRVDTNVDVRVKVLSERFGADREEAANCAGNAVAMLPFFKPHFRSPWYVRKAMTREDKRYMADPVSSIPKDEDEDQAEEKKRYLVGNLSNWSGFTVGTELGGEFRKQYDEKKAGAKLVMHLPINVTAGGTTPFENALVFAPFQDQPKQLAVVFSTHYYDDLVARIDGSQLLVPFVRMQS